MTRLSSAAIVRTAGGPVEITQIAVPSPGPDEVLVRVRSCGVCRTDVHYRDGIIGNDFPYLLGHEAAGTVVETGPNVTEVAVGDDVILNWRAVCGQCRSCRRGRPELCFDTRHAEQKMTIASGPDSGTPLTPALGIGAFSEFTLVAAGQCTPINSAAPAAVAGLLGCGLMAGIGAAVNAAPVRRGDTVAVIGTGGVGCAAVVGAALAGATTIIAVGRSPERLAHAAALGATATVSILDGDPVAAIRRATGGFGADVVIDAVGTPETWKQAFYARDLGGTVVLVGLPVAGATLPDLPLQDVFSRGGALKASWYGDCLPSRDFPALIDLYLRGRLPLDAFVTDTVPLDQVGAALQDMSASHGLRTVVELAP